MTLFKIQMQLRSIIPQYLIPTTLPILLTGFWIPTVLQPRSEHFPDLMASSLVCIMFGFSGSVSATVTEIQVKLGSPFHTLTFSSQNELHKDSHTNMSQ